MATPNDTHISVPISTSPSPPPAPKCLTTASVASTPWSETHPRADPDVLSEEVLWLQRELNATMGWLLTTKASMDSTTETALHQNEPKATKAIKEAKGFCAAMIQDAEATCVAAIREAGNTCVGHAHTSQRSLSKSKQDLECEAMEKERWDHQSFLEAYGVALQACPPKAHRLLIHPLQLLARNMPLTTLLVTTPQLDSTIGKLTPQLLLWPCQRHLHFQQGPNDDAICLTRRQLLQHQGRKNPQC